ncbi:1-aminocyclopropane-1-carboxylate deaminase/D-cysteine desulfhydrase [Pseudoteredinibacter isoporae]|uniref:1-aminocyclopropane-1-carboxylate deaminase/D-cysteine desulfhydrase n=1 Tax=Pseudoteredinibacter isoporae TaxID=570281 RepID=UPI003102E730
MSRPLFEAFPRLKDRIPFLAIAKLPTPIERLPQLAPNLWVKRDDKTNSLYGGNKIRKLEFVLADVLRSGKKELVSFGAIGTNHGVATSIYSLQMDIPLQMILFEQPITSQVQQNLKLMHRFNAQLNFRGSLLKAAATFYLGKWLHGRKRYYLTAGGSTIQGCLAFVNAAFELKQQIDAGLLPEPDYIYCPVGSNATLAGLTLGCGLAGIKSQLVGVRVAPSHLGPIPTCTFSTVRKLQRACYQFLCQIDPGIKQHSLTKFRLIDDYYGRGYGHPSDEGEWAQTMFEQAQLELDPTYTAKTAAAALNCCANHNDKKVLYWHTYNSANVADIAAKADLASMPKALQGFIQAQPL